MNVCGVSFLGGVRCFATGMVLVSISNRSEGKRSDSSTSECERLVVVGCAPCFVVEVSDPSWYSAYSKLFDQYSANFCVAPVQAIPR